MDISDCNMAGTFITECSRVSMVDNLNLDIHSTEYVHGDNMIPMLANEDFFEDSIITFFVDEDLSDDNVDIVAVDKDFRKCSLDMITEDKDIHVFHADIFPLGLICLSLTTVKDTMAEIKDLKNYNMDIVHAVHKDIHEDNTNTMAVDKDSHYTYSVDPTFATDSDIPSFMQYGHISQRICVKHLEQKINSQNNGMQSTMYKIQHSYGV